MNESKALTSLAAVKINYAKSALADEHDMSINFMLDRH